MNILRKMRPSFALTQVLVFAVLITGETGRATGQTGASETVIQRATEQFESGPLTTTSLGQGLYVFSGDGGDVTAIVDDGTTLLIDSGLAWVRTRAKQFQRLPTNAGVEKFLQS
jgi:hypothetical protein